jgi:hypothetical protein
LYGRAAHRAWQFFRATLARVRQAEYALVSARLSAAQTALFCRMARCDRRHCLDVFYTLYEAGYRDDALLRAALIHDVGKSAGRLAVWHRVAVVLMQRFTPAWLARLAADGQGWKAPFAVHVRHPQASAQWAAEAGCASDVVALIRGHHELNPKDDTLAALKWADEQN